ncbi:hypothetical protein [Thiomicrorhabdus sp. 6S3-12]|uniref:hypothetical protein n=1 Tax=Thiomicrorhabdus sp. 6S3-12 TaxID=2819681 RepID=UPI001AAD8AFF|nr:hypothetical protein [Thiomicrorhabdus sp. 6S3-12]MBO1923377.1 hypothetical protein [Thiomicrorhabdus sp. 6S3-12]
MDEFKKVIANIALASLAAGATLFFTVLAVLLIAGSDISAYFSGYFVVSLLIAILGAVIALVVAMLVGVPFYFVMKKRGGLNCATVYGMSVVILVLAVWLSTNKEHPELILWISIAGIPSALIGARVFCRRSGMTPANKV